MKTIKKLTLRKEVVSILGGNDMSLVKGGTYQTVAPCNYVQPVDTTNIPKQPTVGQDTCFTCNTNCNQVTCGNTCNGTCQGTCYGTCDGNYTCFLSCGGTCQNPSCGATCQASCMC